jgi:hypothetical protein
MEYIYSCTIIIQTLQYFCGRNYKDLCANLMPEPEPEPEPEPHLQQPSADEILALAPGLLTQGRQGGGGAPGPLGLAIP